MTKETHKIRLDEILVQEGLISEDQIKEALMRQKAHGGKFGSQLLYHRYIDEAGLVKALSKQYQCEGVVLSNLDIPDIILKFVPSKLAIARKIIPFDYDPEDNVLKIACEDPEDNSLRAEINFVARGKKVKLYIAAELALNTAIAKHYLGVDTSLNDNLLLEIPESATDTGKVTSGNDDSSFADVSRKGTILLVTDEEYAGPLLKSLLERDEYEVVMTDSADAAIDMLGSRTFHTVFIKDTVAGDYIDLIDRLRKLSPRTLVRYYESAGSLLLEKDAFSIEDTLLLKNLDLFTSLLASKDKLPHNHGGTVGQYVAKLCQRLGVPHKDRLGIVNAAYLHDLAKFYYRIENSDEYQRTIDLTIKLLQSLNYSPVVVEMLRSMYADLRGRYTKRLPIEVLGGNILTIVDLLCNNVSVNERLSLDKLDAIQKKFRALTGKLFLPEVVEAFIGMIKEEILMLHTEHQSGQIMILSHDTELLYPLELRLKNEGFRIISGDTEEQFTELYKRSKPDFMILKPEDADVGEVKKYLENLSTKGLEFRKTPTFLMVDSSQTSEFTAVLELGIEDIIVADGNLDLLIAKMKKILAQQLEQSKRINQLSQSSRGTSGRLADMNLIDLVQALGPSRRTVKITIGQAKSPGEPLLLFLHHGDIIFAQLGDLGGAEAVYQAISWTDGTWMVEPVPESELPEANNQHSNESILMEGCRIFDERARSGQLV